MRIFLSYAHEQRREAERLAVRLEEEGHHVFFDRADLGSGDPFDSRIRLEIRKAGLFVFLVSPQSVEPRSYALTELGLARRRWRRAAGRILPVVMEPVPEGSMPEFGVGYLSPEGEWVAEVVARVAEIAGRARRHRLAMTALAAVPAAAAVGLAFLLVDPWKPVPAPPCFLAAEFQPSPGRMASMPEGLVLHVGAGGVTNDFPVGRDGTCRFAVDGSRVSNWDVDLTSADGLAWGRATLQGCPSAIQKVALDDGSSLTLRPQ